MQYTYPMNRDIFTTIHEDFFQIDMRTPYQKTRIFGYYDNVVFILTNDFFAHHIAQSLYDDNSMEEFQYLADDNRPNVLIRLKMKPGRNFFESDFTMFNWNLFGEESKHFIWE